MALGGWIYHTMAIASFDHNNDALWESNVIDPFITMMAGVSGWSVQLAKTKYFADSGWHFRFVHSSGAVLACVVVGETTSSTTYIEGSNTWDGNNKAGSAITNRFLFSYWPPGNSGAGAAAPNNSGYVPSDGLQFYPGSRFDGILSGNTHRIQVLARGDDLIICFERNADPIDWISWMGSFVVPFHASDSGSRNAEIMLHRTYTPDWKGRYFADDNTSRLRNDDTVLIDNYSWLTTSVNDTAPWSYVHALVAKASARLGDVNRFVVPASSSFKGVINTEALRLVAPGGPANKQRLESGNLIHIGSGVVVGYDSGNGAMS